MGEATVVSDETMGRRKIEMEYLVDDRVRKVTFCKRKGGLFKKADDLSKLCGVEVAVVIVCENKTCQFASTDMDRILTRYRQINGNQPPSQSETDRLWGMLENQRREIEMLQRQLSEERKKVEVLVGGDVQMVAVQPALNMAIPTTSSAAVAASVANGSAEVAAAAVATQLPASTAAAQAATPVSLLGMPAQPQTAAALPLPTMQAMPGVLPTHAVPQVVHATPVPIPTQPPIATIAVPVEAANAASVSTIAVPVEAANAASVLSNVQVPEESTGDEASAPDAQRIKVG